jgi:hypothetical protein
VADDGGRTVPVRLFGALVAAAVLGVAGWWTARAGRRAEIDRTCAVITGTLTNGRGPLSDADRAALGDLIAASRRRMRN